MPACFIGCVWWKQLHGSDFPLNRIIRLLSLFEGHALLCSNFDIITGYCPVNEQCSSSYFASLWSSSTFVNVIIIIISIIIINNNNTIIIIIITTTFITRSSIASLLVSSLQWGTTLSSKKNRYWSLFIRIISSFTQP